MTAYDDILASFDDAIADGVDWERSERDRGGEGACKWWESGGPWTAGGVGRRGGLVAGFGWRGINRHRIFSRMKRDIDFHWRL
ncbi:hypothetical protein ACFX2I_041417 [Malus domestica]